MVEDKGMDPATRFKFRAWDPVNSRMYKAPCIVFEPDGTHEAYEDAREWEDGIQRKSILMAWTGLKDRNGVEIYEGDIVRHPDDGVFKIQWYCDRWEVFQRRSDIQFDARNLYSVSNIVEVLGNIYEHPALLSAPPKEGSK